MPLSIYAGQAGFVFYDNVRKKFYRGAMAEGISYNTLVRIARDVGLEPDRRTMKRSELLAYIIENGPPELTSEKLRVAMHEAAEKNPARIRPTPPPPQPPPPAAASATIPDLPPAAPASPTAVPATTKVRPTVRVRDDVRQKPAPALTKHDVSKIIHKNAKRHTQKEEPAGQQQTPSQPPPKTHERVVVGGKYQDVNGRWRWADGPQKGKFCKK
jgi:hypothetical protein